MQSFRFATWNINNRNPKQSHMIFLRGLDLDILCLQEASRKFFDGLSSEGIFEHAYFSLDYVDEDILKSRARRLGCAIFCSTDVVLQSPRLLELLPFPERSLVCEADIFGDSSIVCSFHTPPGASWKDLKPKSHVLLSKWLASRESPVLLGIDANAPKVDHPDYSQNVWWWPDEPKLLGEDRIHDLRDSFRDYLKHNPDAMKAIKQDRPEGPLAKSYIRGNYRKMTPSRYDFIFVSPEFRVHNVEYLYDESTKAGSDHALVLAELA
jgi:exonuclease III